MTYLYRLRCASCGRRWLSGSVRRLEATGWLHRTILARGHITTSPQYVYRPEDWMSLHHWQEQQDSL